MSVFDNEKPEVFHFLRLSLSLDWGLFLPPTKAKSAKGSRSCIRQRGCHHREHRPHDHCLDFAEKSLLYRLSDKRSHCDHQ